MPLTKASWSNLADGTILYAATLNKGINDTQTLVNAEADILNGTTTGAVLLGPSGDVLDLTTIPPAPPVAARYYKGGGRLHWLASQSISGGAGFTFPNILDGRFSRFIVEIIRLVPGNSNDSLNLRVAESGSNWISTNLYDYQISSMTTGPTLVPYANTSTQALMISPSIGSLANWNNNAQIEIIDPAGSAYKMFRTRYGGIDGSPSPVQQIGGGTYLGTNPITGIFIFCATGTLTGMATVYAVLNV